MSPRRASHFLCLAKESNQRKATPLRVTLRFATGNLRCSLQAGSAQTRFAQTRAALHPPEAALLGARRGEVGRAIAALGRQRPCCARPGTAHAYAHVRGVCMPECMSRALYSGRACASCSNPTARARGAQLLADQGRACLSEASLRGPREKRAPQASRSEAQGCGQWGRLFFGYFLLAKQKKVTRLPGRHPGSGLKPRARYASSVRRPHPSPPPEGEGVKRGPPSRRRREQVRAFNQRELALSTPARPPRSAPLAGQRGRRWHWARCRWRGAMASTEPFPSRAVTLWVPWPAGGATDVSLRLLAELAGSRSVSRCSPTTAAARVARWRCRCCSRPARRLHHRPDAAAGFPRAAIRRRCCGTRSAT